MTNIGDQRDEFINTDHTVPADLLELFEVLEWQKAVEAQEADQGAEE